MAKRQKTRLPRRRCGAIEVYHRLLEMHPDFRLRQIELEHATARRMMSREPLRVGITTIPVVVHVVYNTPSENISNAQIKSQIAVLNRDFRATNKDKTKVPAVWRGLVANARIRFALAAKVQSALGAAGFNLGINNGKAAGQEVFHVHVHIIPRYPDDGGGSMKSVAHFKGKETVEQIAAKLRPAFSPT